MEKKFQPETWLKSLRTEKNFKPILEDFSTRVDRYNSQSDEDVIFELLNATAKSGRYVEIVNLLEDGNQAIADIECVFKVLQQILNRVSEDLHQFISVGIVVAQQILRTRLKSIYSLLQQKGKFVKTTLRLLTAFVSLSAETALEVISHFNFKHSYVGPLVTRVDTKDVHDIRRCYIDLLLSFLLTDSNNLIQQLLERGLVKTIFSDLPLDKATTINVFLSTVLDKVIRNKSITKTLKVRLLEESVLLQIMKLFSWKSAQKRTTKRSNGYRHSKEELQPLPDGEFSEDQLIVFKIAQQFLSAVCCSTKEGIIFRDASVGTSAKNENHLITTLLLAVQKPYVSSNVKELISNILMSCPDQLRFYMPSFESSVVPRTSEQWFSTIDFITEMYDSQKPFQILERFDDKIPTPKLIPMISVMTIPRIITQTISTQALEHESRSVRHKMLEAILHTVSRVSKVIADLQNSSRKKIKAYLESDVPVIVQGLIKAVMKVLPQYSTIVRLWPKVKSDEPGTKESEKISTIEHLELILEVQSSLLQILPPNTVNWLLDLESLLGRSNDFCGDSEEAILTQYKLKIIETIVKLETSNKSRSISTKLHSSIVQFLIETVVKLSDVERKNKPADILAKVLIGTNLFNNSEEILVWIHYLTKYGERSPLVGKLVTESIKKLMKNNNANHVDELVEDATIQTATSDKLEETHPTSNCVDETVSSLIFAIFTIASENEEFANDKHCRKFLSRVAFDVYHMQLNSGFLDSVLKDNSSLLTKSFQKYLKDICKDTAEKKSKALTKTPMQDLQEFLQHVIVNRTVRCPLITENELHENFEHLTSFSMRRAVDQCLFYLTVLSTEKNSNQGDFVRLYCDLLLKLIHHSRQEENVQVDAKSPWLYSTLCPVEQIILRHPVIQENFLTEDPQNEPFTFLIADVAFMLQGDHNKFTVYFAYYFRKTLKFIRRLSSDIENLPAVSSKSSEVIKVFVNQVPFEDAISLLETTSEKVFVHYQWLTVTLCNIASQVVSRDKTPYLSGECIEKLAGLIKEEQAGTAVVKLLTSYPLYSCVFKEDFVEKFFSSDNSMSLEVMNLLLPYNAFLQAQFESLVPRSRLIPLLKTYLLSQAHISKGKSKKQQKWIRSKVSTVVDQFEEVKCLNLKSCFTNISGSDDAAIVILCILLEFGRKDLIEGLSELKANDAISLLKLFTSDETNFALCKSTVDRIDDDEILNRLLGANLLLVQNNIDTLQSESGGFTLSSLIEISLILVNKVEKMSKTILSDHETLDWESLMKTLLNASLSNSDRYHVFPLLIRIVEKSLHNKRFRSVTSVSFIWDLIFGHSNFFSILCNLNESCKIQKNNLISLLSTLVSLDSTICKAAHIPLLLASYTATLSGTDQNILRLLSLYETNGINLYEYTPFIWSKAAIMFYSIRKDMSFTLHKLPSIEEVLQNLKRDVLRTTAFNFPVDLLMQTETEFSAVDPSLYDPRFLLPLLSHLLSPSAFVHCSKLIDSHVLPVVIAALSSHCSKIRSIAYYVLSLVYGHFESARFKQKMIWLHILDAIRNGIKQPNDRLPNMITIFLVKVSFVILNPDDPNFDAVTSFVLLKPALDMENVPDFLKMFNSSELQFRKRRSWMLQLIAEGTKDNFDYYLCEKCKLVKIVLSFNVSTLNTTTELEHVSDILMVFAGIPVAATRLVVNGRILAYLHRMLLQRSADNREITKISKLLHKLWFSLLKGKPLDVGTVSSSGDKNEVGDTSVSLPIAAEYFLILETVVQLISSKTSVTHWSTITFLMDSVCEVLEKMRLALPAEEQNCITCLPSTKQLQHLLEKHREITESDTCVQALPTSIKVGTIHDIYLNRSLLQCGLWIMIHQNINESSEMKKVYLNEEESITFLDIAEHSLMASAMAGRASSDYLSQLIAFLKCVLLCDIGDDHLMVAEKLVDGSLQSRKIVTYLLNLYQIYCPTAFSDVEPPELDKRVDTNEVNVLIGLNEVSLHLVHASTQVEKSCFSDLIKAEDYARALRTVTRLHKLLNESEVNGVSHTVTIPLAVSLFVCEYFMQKPSPTQFDGFVRSTGLSNLKKRERNESDSDKSSKKEKKKRMRKDGECENIPKKQKTRSSKSD